MGNKKILIENIDPDMELPRPKLFKTKDMVRTCWEAYIRGVKSELVVKEKGAVNICNSGRYVPVDMIKDLFGITMKVDQELTYERLSSFFKNPDLLQLEVILEYEGQDVMFVAYPQHPDTIFAFFVNDDELKAATHLFEEIETSIG